MSRSVPVAASYAKPAEFRASGAVGGESCVHAYRVDVTAALRLLASQGVVSILVEGGAELAGSILAARLADELHAFVAPVLLGPRGRPGAVDWAGPDTPTEAPRIVDPRWELVGRDAYVSGPLAFPSKA